MVALLLRMDLRFLR